jgi:hypothetical protein
MNPAHKLPQVAKLKMDFYPSTVHGQKYQRRWNGKLSHDLKACRPRGQGFIQKTKNLLRNLQTDRSGFLLAV